MNQGMAVNAAAQAGFYLGPARVGKIREGQVELVFPDQTAWGQVCINCLVQPQVNDIVLAIGQDEIWYVIGMIHCRGEMALRAAGDLKLFAPNGQIQLAAGKGVNIQSPAVRIVADSMELVARTFLEKFVNASRWVKEVFRLKARHSDTKIEEAHRVRAGRIIQRAAGNVHVDGNKIHLG